MALNSTIYKVELQISDMDRHYYATHALTLARHPSETEERLMVRLLGMHNLLPLDGGLPLIVGGEVIGAIGVSGMQSTQDAQVAAAGVAALAGDRA